MNYWNLTAEIRATNPDANGHRRFSIGKQLLAVLLLLAGCEGSIQAQVSSSVSGFCSLRIQGTHGTSPSTLSFLGLGLTRHPVAEGRVDAFGAGTVTDSRAKWVDGQFDGSNGPHYFEITSGPYAGFTTDILATQGTAKTLLLSYDLSSLLSGGESYKIRPHWTLATVFGPADESGLGGGSCISADEILLLDAQTCAYTTYFYKTIGLGGTGWRSTASISTDQSNAQIPLGQGILIRRKQAVDLSVKLFGAAKSGNTLLQIAPGLNIIANIAPSGLVLGNSGLYTGDPTSGLAGGSNVSADKLLLFDGTSYQTFYYKTLGLGGTGWRSAASPSQDASTTVIPAGAGLLIQRSTAAPRLLLERRRSPVVLF